MDLTVLYPSSSAGSGVTSSPLSSPAALVASVVPSEPAQVAAAAPAESTDPAFDWDAHDRELGVGKYAETNSGAGEGSEAGAAPAAAEPVLDARPKIEDALRGARSTEPAASSVTDFGSFTRYPEGVTPDPVERDQALGSFVKAGLGVTQAQALWQAGMQALKEPITTNTVGALEALGPDADSLVADARAAVAKAEKTWPSIKDFLNRSGLGNDPATIRFLAQRKG